MVELAGVVLCGGSGRRMGQNKAHLDVQGTPLVRRVADRLAAVASRVVIAGADRDLPELPYERIADRRAGAGPLAGIVAALRAVDEPLLAVVAGDMPHANADLIALLVRAREDEDVVLPVDDHGRQPLHAIYSASSLEPLELALDRERFALREALTAVRVREVHRDQWARVDPAGRFAFNVNEPADLRSLG